MRGDLARGIGDVHDLGGLAPVLAAVLAVPEPEVQRRARHDDEIGLAECQRPGPGHQQLVTGRENAAALPVRHDRKLEFLGGRPGRVRGPVQPDIRAEHQHRPLRPSEQRDDVRDAAGVRRVVLAAWAAGVPARFLIGGIGRPEQSLQADIQEDRPAVSRGRQRECVADRTANAAAAVLGPGTLGDRPEQGRVVELLQAAGSPAVVGRPAAEHDHARPVEMRGRDRADAVRHPRAGRQHREAWRPGQAGGRLGGEDGRLLVPDVEDRHRRVRLDRAVVDRKDVAAREREDRLRTVRPRCGDRLGAAMRDRLLVGNHGRDVTRQYAAASAVRQERGRRGRHTQPAVR